MTKVTKKKWYITCARLVNTYRANKIPTVFTGFLDITTSLSQQQLCSYGWYAYKIVRQISSNVSMKTTVW